MLGRFARYRASAPMTCVVAFNAASTKVAATPDPVVDDYLAATSGQQTVVLSGGCFWGIRPAEPSALPLNYFGIGME